MPTVAEPCTGRRSNADLVRAIRHGLRTDSTSLILMPSEVFVNLTDEDLGAIIGYIRRLPPVDRELPPTHLRLLGRALLVAGKLNLLVAAKTPAFSIASCHGCHGSRLSGGPLGAPGLPPAANITSAGLSSWTERDFFTAMRQGRRPGGAQLHEIMPWKAYREMTDEELMALWRYLESVPSRATGQK